MSQPAAGSSFGMRGSKHFADHSGLLGESRTGSPCPGTSTSPWGARLTGIKRHMLAEAGAELAARVSPAADCMQ